ncbi:related to Ras-like G protein RagD [Ustilago trichophora]|uniref:Related to Ras-like G protein RagD n=1 Tax=Ustilago trichophora TaxID=86804 RepID=A0A5C3E206_9BASI|nr:related to Ras-like G protein RagD [Ustilago trichophora]
METKRLQVPVIGLRRSGKSSILNVVYNELHPDDTVFLESTTKPSFILSDSFLPIRIIDTPSRVLLGDVRLEKGIPLAPATGARAGPPPPVPARNAPTQSHSGNPAHLASGSIPAAPELLPWTEVSAVIFVIDAQDDYYEALSKLQSIILSAFAENQTIDFHVFVHKIDGYSNDYRQDTLSTIQGKVLDDLVDSSPSFIAQPWSYPEPLPQKETKGSQGGKDRSRGKSKDLSFSRSPAAGNSSSGGGGYDASASEFSSFSGGGGGGGGYRSDVAPEPGLINLDQAVRLHCHATSIYDTSVFVAISKLQQSLAQKVKPEEPIDVAEPHPQPPASSSNGEAAAETSKPTRPAAATLRRALTLAESMEQVCDSICSTCRFENAFLFDLPTRTFIGSDSAPFDTASFDIVFDYAGFLAKFASLYAGVQSEPAQPSTPAAAAAASSSTAQLSTSPSSARRFLLGRISKDTTVRNGDATTTPKTVNQQTVTQRWASSVTRLQPDRSLCFWQINHRLALIALIHSDVHAKQTGLIDYNITFFRRAVQGLYGLAQTST